MVPTVTALLPKQMVPPVVPAMVNEPNAIASVFVKVQVVCPSEKVIVTTEPVTGV